MLILHHKSYVKYKPITLNAGNNIYKEFNKPIRNYIFTGSLIARKHPDKLYNALSKAYPDGDFTIKYIGDGNEQGNIEREHYTKRIGNIIFTGRIDRECIIEHLKQAEVFAMISEQEVFGLVYIEAMALGLITIGSRNEGIDGIIVDGENGFLCDAGNENELIEIITKIKNMSSDQLKSISDKARKTAIEFSDKRVAEKYINNIKID